MAPLFNSQSSSPASSPAGVTKRAPKTLVTFLSGATSGCISTLALQPLDVVKTRMQMSAAYNRSVHLQPALTLQPNASALDTFRGIVRQDHILGLWRGVTPSVLRNTMGVGVYFMTLNALTARLVSPDGTLSDAATFLSGATARSLVVVLLCPLSVVKTRMETVEYANKYTGVANAIKTIATLEGRTGLFSGLFPAIFRDAPFSAMYMLIYLRTKQSLGHAVGLKDTRSSITSTHDNTASPSTSPQISSASQPQHNQTTQPPSTETQSPNRTQSQNSQQGLTRIVNFASGALGGGLATLITQPMDVVKTRMQLSQKTTDGSPSRYRTLTEATRRVFNEEGVYGFFRGASPRFMKRILGSAITWMVFEEANAFYTNLIKQFRAGGSQAR